MTTPAGRQKFVLCPGDTKTENQTRVAMISLCKNCHMKDSGQCTKLPETDLVWLHGYMTTRVTLPSCAGLDETISNNDVQKQLDSWHIF